MPLDEREQRILEEIEAQFYEDDPAFAQSVRDTTLKAVTGRRVRWAAVGFVVGLVVMLAMFTVNPIIALVGFVLMVASAVWIVTVLRRQRGGDGGSGVGWLDQARQKWRRGG